MTTFTSNLLATFLGVIFAAMISFWLWKKQQKEIENTDFNVVKKGLIKEINKNSENLEKIEPWFRERDTHFSTQDNMDLSFFESAVSSGKLFGFYEVLQKTEKIDLIEKIKTTYCDLKTFNHRFRKYSDCINEDRNPSIRIKKNMHTDILNYIKNIKELEVGLQEKQTPSHGVSSEANLK